MVTGMLDVPVRKNLNDMATAYMDAADMYPVPHAVSKTGMHLQASNTSDE